MNEQASRLNGTEARNPSLFEFSFTVCSWAVQVSSEGSRVRSERRKLSTLSFLLEHMTKNSCAAIPYAGPTTEVDAWINRKTFSNILVFRYPARPPTFQHFVSRFLPGKRRDVNYAIGILLKLQSTCVRSLRVITARIWQIGDIADV